MNSTEEALVDDYLRRLEQAAYALPPERRAELVLEIRDHIEEARAAAGGRTDEAWTRSLLDRMGTPAEIVAAATEGEPGEPHSWTPPQPVLVERRPGTSLELAAVLLLTIGSAIFLVGWLAGVVCLWSSQRWRTWEKVVGTLVVPGGPLGMLWVATLLPAQSCFSSSVSDSSGETRGTGTTCSGFAFHPVVGIPLLLFALIGPIVVAGWLYSRARARAALEPPDLVPVGPPRAGSPWGGLEVAAVVLLAAGAFVLPFIGPVVGLVLAWTSSAWTSTEKVVATAVASIGLLVPLGLVVGFVAA